jgi:hypothetical protein
VCKCVLFYCHRVSTQLQLNIHHIKEQAEIEENESKEDGNIRMRRTNLKSLERDEKDKEQTKATRRVYR